MNITLKNRSILPKIIQELNNDLVLILIGPRQAGKTKLLELICQHLKNKEPNIKIFSFDLDKAELLVNFTNDKTTLDFLLAQGVDKNKINYVILDEFQNMPAPTKTLKVLHDHCPYLKILASGSSSLEIYKKLRQESMAGRKMVFAIFPLSFAEYLEFNEEEKNVSQLFSNSSMDVEISPVIANLINARFENFSLWGGYPRLALQQTEAGKESTLSELYNSYLNRDVAGFLNIKNNQNFIKLAGLLAAQSGNLLNLNELSKQTGIPRLQIEKILFLLENTFVVKLLRPFFNNKQKEITKMPKIYFIDNGLRNFLLRNFNPMDNRPDNGALIENSILMEIIKCQPILTDIHFWRTPQGAEVDFILQSQGQIIPIESKYSNFSKPIVPSGMKAFIEKYRPQQGFVLTKDFSAYINWQNCHIRFLPAFLISKIISHHNFQNNF